MSTPPPAIEVVGLRKSFGDKVVLDAIDLTVPTGTIFSLLGPNGAGKTTAVSIMTTLILADGGQVRVEGHDIDKKADAVRSAISVTGQFSAVDNLLTGEENLIMMGDLLHLGRQASRQRAAELLEKFDLVAAGKKRAQAYSGGMRRRLDLAMTLVGNPRIIFLDEPTTGLDPRSRHTMWEIVRELVAGGTTIFLTTQHLEEADQLADRIAVLNNGKLVAEGSADELKRRIPGSYVRLKFTAEADLTAAERLFGTGTREPKDLALRIPSDGKVGTVRALLDRLDDAAIDADELTIITPDLDDVFLALTDPSTMAKDSVR